MRLGPVFQSWKRNTTFFSAVWCFCVATLENVNPWRHSTEGFGDTLPFPLTLAKRFQQLSLPPPSIAWNLVSIRPPFPSNIRTMLVTTLREFVLGLFGQMKTEPWLPNFYRLMGDLVIKHPFKIVPMHTDKRASLKQFSLIDLMCISCYDSLLDK